MGTLSPHISLSEITCKCGCSLDKINPELIYILEAVREHFGKPITITSGCRCKKWNTFSGGATSSQHLPQASGYCNAADIKVKDVMPGEVADYCEDLVRDRGGCGRYGAWTHVDCRGYKARWGP